MTHDTVFDILKLNKHNVQYAAEQKYPEAKVHVRGPYKHPHQLGVFDFSIDLELPLAFMIHTISIDWREVQAQPSKVGEILRLRVMDGPSLEPCLVCEDGRNLKMASATGSQRQLLATYRNFQS